MLKRHSFPTSTTIKPRRASLRISTREPKSIDNGLSQKSITISKKTHRNEKTTITSPKTKNEKNKLAKTLMRSPSQVIKAPETNPYHGRVSSIGSQSLSMPDPSPSTSVSSELKDREFAHVCPECKEPLRKSLFWRHFMGKHRGKTIDLKSIKKVPIVDIERAPIVDNEHDNDALIREFMETGKFSDL